MWSRGFVPLIRGHIQVTRIIHVALIPRMTPADIWLGAAAAAAPAGPARVVRRFIPLWRVRLSRIIQVVSGVVGITGRAL